MARKNVGHECVMASNLLHIPVKMLLQTLLVIFAFVGLTGFDIGSSFFSSNRWVNPFRIHFDIL